MLDALLKYRVDIWPVLLIVATFAAQASVYLWVDHVGWVILAELPLFVCCMSVLAFNHNHIHCHTFKQGWLNRILELMMFFQTGISPFSSTINHILGHHANYFDPSTDTLNWKRPDGSVKTRRQFSIEHALNHYPSCFKFGPQKPVIFAKFRFYLVISIVLLALVVIYKPANALVLFVIPMVLLQYMLKWAAYPHHSGVEIGNDFTASRTNIGAIYNKFTWNAGYHLAHHVKQAHHWSLLPELHQSIADKVPAQLVADDWPMDVVTYSAHV